MLNCKKLVVVLLPAVVLGMLLASSGIASAQTGKANLSIATPEQLVKVPGITPELAKAIIAYKAANGFASPDDLMKVPGMTPEIFKKLSPSADKNGNIIIGAGASAAEKEGADDEEEAVLRKY